MKYAVQVGVFCLLLVLGRTYTAVFWDESRDCPFDRSYCHCISQFEIDCAGRNMDRVPPTSRFAPWAYRVINLKNNRINTINASNFANVNVTDVLLGENRISSIEDGAFNNLRDDLKKLELANNQLTFLPRELGTLNKLEYLDLRGNPISYVNFDDNIMRQMGDYMRYFYFGYEHLSVWPGTIRHFQQLRHLELLGGSMLEFPISAFQGFEWTLQELSIRNTMLIYVPIALQYVHNIQVFNFDNNILVGDAGILAPAFAGMVNTVRTLTLENNSLTDFPDILLTLRVIENLSLSKNRIKFVSDTSVQKLGSPHLKNLTLHECGLDRIPGAIAQLTNLTELDLSNNNIRTIESNDLSKLIHLENVTLDNNPVAYVSNSSFKDLISLKRLEMRNTNVNLVPEAIRNIPNLQVVDLSGPTPIIECNCESMTWLFKLLQNRSFIIYGDCETIADSLQNYAITRVPANCL